MAQKLTSTPTSFRTPQACRLTGRPRGSVASKRPAGCVLPAARLFGRPLCRSSVASLAGAPLPRGCSNGRKWTAAQWIENSASTDVDVPVEEAWALWDDRTMIPTWMPWVDSVTIEEGNPKMSRWTLKTTQFGRDWTLSWLAQNLTPIPLQKIHWKSVPGSMSVGIEVANRGSIRFFRRSPKSCNVTLTISYEVPDALAPFANALQPLVESVIGADMQRFQRIAVERSARR